MRALVLAIAMMVAITPAWAVSGDLHDVVDCIELCMSSGGIESVCTMKHLNAEQAVRKAKQVLARCDAYDKAADEKFGSVGGWLNHYTSDEGRNCKAERAYIKQ